MRGTLHLVDREDYWWLHGLTALAAATGGESETPHQEGVSPADAERAVAVVEQAH